MNGACHQVVKVVILSVTPSRSTMKTRASCMVRRSTQLEAGLLEAFKRNGGYLILFALKHLDMLESSQM